MKLRLESGEEAEVQSLEGNTMTMQSPRAFAPGSPIRFSIAGVDSHRPFEGRTIQSKRSDAGLFRVTLRFVNLRRADRQLLEQSLR